MESEVASASLQRLLGIGKSVLSALAQDGVVVRGEKRGTFVLEASVSSYCKRPASARGGEDAVAVRAKLAWRRPTLPPRRSRRCAARLGASFGAALFHGHCADTKLKPPEADCSEGHNVLHLL